MGWFYKVIVLTWVIIIILRVLIKCLAYPTKLQIQISPSTNKRTYARDIKEHIQYQKIEKHFDKSVSRSNSLDSLSLFMQNIFEKPINISLSDAKSLFQDTCWKDIQ